MIQDQEKGLKSRERWIIKGLEWDIIRTVSVTATSKNVSEFIGICNRANLVSQNCWTKRVGQEEDYVTFENNIVSHFRILRRSLSPNFKRLDRENNSGIYAQLPRSILFPCSRNITIKYPGLYLSINDLIYTRSAASLNKFQAAFISVNAKVNTSY